MTTHSSILAWENPMDRGVCQATVHGIAKSQTWLKKLRTAYCTPLCIFASANKMWMNRFTWSNKENVEEELSKLITCKFLGMVFQINTDAPGNLTKVFQCEIFPVTCLICMRVCVSKVDTLMFVLSYSPVNTVMSNLWLSQVCRFKCGTGNWASGNRAVALTSVSRLARDRSKCSHPLPRIAWKDNGCVR